MIHNEGVDRFVAAYMNEYPSAAMAYQRSLVILCEKVSVKYLFHLP